MHKIGVYMQNNSLNLKNLCEFKEIVTETSGDEYMKIIRDLIEFDPFSGHPFYIFSFIKLQNRERFHQPRLTKPEPVPGGTLIRVDPLKPEEMKICWTLPGEDVFKLYKYKKALSDQFVYECIKTYKTNPEHLCQPEVGDVSDEKAAELYTTLRNRIARIKEKEAKLNDLTKLPRDSTHITL